MAINVENLRHASYDPEQYCTTRQAAQILGVSLRTVQLWVESGELSAWKTAGGHRRIPLQSLQRFVLAREQATEAAYARPPDNAPVSRENAARRILVVDDDEDILLLFRMQLAHWQPPVMLETAHDGFEAMLKIGQHQPDVLITDINMPGIDGFRMLKKLRANPEYSALIIIVVSGLELQTIRAGGIDESIPVLNKPVPFDTLQQLIAERLH